MGFCQPALFLTEFLLILACSIQWAKWFCIQVLISVLLSCMLAILRFLQKPSVNKGGWVDVVQPQSLTNTRMRFTCNDPARHWRRLATRGPPCCTLHGGWCSEGPGRAAGTRQPPPVAVAAPAPHRAPGYAWGRGEAQTLRDRPVPSADRD